MIHDEGSCQRYVRNELLKRFVEDQANGALAPLEHYQALFPGHEDLLAEEYDRLCSEIAPQDKTPSRLQDDHPPRRIGQYTLLDELGRGAYGVVYVAEDERLRRKVAVKLLTTRAAFSSDVRSRFLREAQAASRLDHPCICGVYEVGEEDGVPFIAMRYVDGVTLAERIAALAGGRPTGTDPSLVELDVDQEAHPPGDTTERSPSNRREIHDVVRVIERAARALHVAHEAGLVHRDIKPGNIMITTEGDPVLLDFGLARDETSNAPTLTQTGQLMGTPAYMAPEQIAAKRIVVDRRADVYSLGVTLYECLTLKQPFKAPTRESLYHAIMTKEAPDPRRLNPAVSRDLLAIVQTALEKNLDRRYQTAAALADDLRAFRDGRPVSVKPISAIGRAMRWARRRPAAAGLVAALFIGSSAVTGLFVDRLANLEKVREAERHRVREETDARLALGSLLLAEGPLADALPAFQSAIEVAASPIPEAVGGLALAHLNMEGAERALRVLDHYRPREGEHPGLGRIRAAALRRAGKAEAATKLEASLGAPRDALSCFLLGQQQLHLGKKGDKEAARAALGLFTRAILHSDGPRAVYFFERVRAAVGCQDLIEAAATAETLTSHWPDSAMAWFCAGLGLQDFDPDRAMAAYREAIRLRPDYARAYTNLGNVLRTKGRLDDAIAAYRNAIRIKADLAKAHYNLAIALVDKGFVDEAIAAYEKAIRLEPDYFMARYNLGNTLRRKGLLDEAIAVYRQAVRVKPDDAEARNNLAVALLDKGLVDQTITACEEALRLDPDLAAAHITLGAALRQKGLVDEAIAVGKEAIRLAPDSALAHHNLGAALLKEGLVNEAIGEFKLAIHSEPDLALPHNGLGNALRAEGLVDGAIAAFKDALRLDPNLALAYNGLGTAFIDKGLVKEAIDASKDAIRLRPNFPQAYNTLGNALNKKGLVDQAIAAYRDAIRLDPEYGLAYSNLGTALRRKGRVDEAITAFADAIRCQPDNAVAHMGRGVALRAKGRVDEAIAAFQEAVRLDPDYAAAHCNLGVALNDKGRVGEAIAAHRKAIRLEPDLAMAHFNLGVALAKRGRVDEAIAAYRDAIRLEPGLASAHYSLGNAFRTKKRFDEAVVAYEDALRIRPQWAEVNCNLGLALWSVGHLGRALRALRKGHEIGSRRRGWRYESARWVSNCERAVLRGAGEAAAKGLRDDDTLDAASSIQPRRNAARWLRELVVGWRDGLKKGIEKPARVRKLVAQLERHPVFARLKDPDLLTRLEPAEREVWSEIWAAVDELLEGFKH